MTLLRFTLFAAALTLMTTATVALAHAPHSVEDVGVRGSGTSLAQPGARVSSDRRITRCGTPPRPHTVGNKPIVPSVEVAHPWTAADTAQVVGLLDLADAIVRGFADFDSNTASAHYERVIRGVLAQRQLTPWSLKTRLMSLGERFSADQDGALAALMPLSAQAVRLSERFQELPVAAGEALSVVFRFDSSSR